MQFNLYLISYDTFGLLILFGSPHFATELAAAVQNINADETIEIGKELGAPAHDLKIWLYHKGSIHKISYGDR